MRTTVSAASTQSRDPESALCVQVLACHEYLRFTAPSFESCVVFKRSRGLMGPRSPPCFRSPRSTPRSVRQMLEWLFELVEVVCVLDRGLEKLPLGFFDKLTKSRRRPDRGLKGPRRFFDQPLAGIGHVDEAVEIELEVLLQ